MSLFFFSHFGIIFSFLSATTFQSNCFCFCYCCYFLLVSFWKMSKWKSATTKNQNYCIQTEWMNEWMKTKSCCKRSNCFNVNIYGEIESKLLICAMYHTAGDSQLTDIYVGKLLGKTTLSHTHTPNTKWKVFGFNSKWMAIAKSETE